ncbi:MAG: hypothetical protein AB1791_04245 [Chloroflexota bacterium]
MYHVSRAKLAQAEYVLQQIRDEWLARPGVTAVGLGFKWRDGRMTQEVSIRVHVVHKKPLTELSETERFPKVIQGVPVDVVEATYSPQSYPLENALVEAGSSPAAAPRRNERHNPVLLGVSVGSRFSTAGTLGAKVIDLDNGQEMILSNWHVLAGSNEAAAGLPIWQPGRIDGGQEQDTIATLSRWELGPHDAAVAALNSQRRVEAKTLEGRLIETATSPQLGMLVWKSGRSTGYTEGLIDAVKMTVPIEYPQAGQHTLTDVAHIVPRPGATATEISRGGDSGAIWVDVESGKAVALHFGGEVGDEPEYALAHDITAVTSQLRVRFPIASPPPRKPTSKPSPWQGILAFFQRLFAPR